jgi:DNA-binding NtrC family response regulator
MTVLLAIDADAAVRRTYRLALAPFGDVAEAASPVEAAGLIAQTPPGLIVAEWPTDGSGPAAFAMLRQWAPGVPLVAVLTWRTPDEENLARDAGAAACLAKPLRLEQLGAVTASLLEGHEPAREVHAPRPIHPPDPPAEPAPPAPNLIARSPDMQALLAGIDACGPASFTLTGEPGTGKRTLALHAAGLAWVQGGGLAIDAAAGMEDRLRAEIDAALNPASVPPPPIVVIEAHGLPEPLQRRLLQALDDGRRLIATTSTASAPAWLPEPRLAVPPLRERPEDVADLAHRLLQTLCRALGLPPKKLDLEAADVLAGLPWPGNLRQLEGVLAEAAARHPDIPVLERSHLTAPQDAPGAPHLEGVVALSLREATRRFERRLITQALEEAAGVQAQAAEKLGTTRRILKYKMDQLGLS